MSAQTRSGARAGKDNAKAGPVGQAKQLARRSTSAIGAATHGLRMLPDYLIVGAQRCGTTSLQLTLTTHPQVRPPLFRKGVHYFDLGYQHGLDWYRGQFPIRSMANLRAGGRAVTGEASPYYMFHPLAPQRFAADLPGVRAIAMLRNPIERAFSAHKQEVWRGFETESFERALDLEAERLAGEAERMIADPSYVSLHLTHHAYVGRGEYVAQIVRLRELLGPDRVLVVDADDYFVNPGAQWPRIVEFLGLDPWTPPHFEHANARPSSPMPDHVRARLVEHFRPLDADLESLLGRPMSWQVS